METNTSSNGPSMYAKAIMAAVTAGLGTLFVALNNGNGVDSTEWITVVSTTVAAFALTWGVPNSIGSTTSTPMSNSVGVTSVVVRDPLPQEVEQYMINTAQANN